jgi:hypothetical protein
MRGRIALLCTVALLAAASLTLAACGAGASGAASSPTPAASASSSAAPSPPGGAAPGAPPNGSSTGGQGGAPGGSTARYTPTGASTLKGGSATRANATYAASGADQSAILAASSAKLTLTDPTITKSGDSKSSDESSFYGLNAGVLATSGARVAISGGSVTTTGAGANGVFAYGSGSSVAVSGATIRATAQYAHGAMASGGGSVSLTNVRITTAGANSAAVATDRGGGTAVVRGGTIVTSGRDAPGLYSTGVFTVSGARITATAAEGAVIEGSNSISLADTSLTGATNGVMLYQSGSGDAQQGTAKLSISGGSLTARGEAIGTRFPSGNAFFVDNTTAVIKVKGGATIKSTGDLVAAASSGKVTFSAAGETLAGNVVTDSTSSASLTLTGATTLTGTIAKAALTLDSSSKWRLTADSTLTALSDKSGVSGGAITNIVGNGHTVTYDAGLAADKYLGGKTYSLVDGGSLVPR